MVKSTLLLKCCNKVLETKNKKEANYHTLGLLSPLERPSSMPSSVSSPLSRSCLTSIFSRDGFGISGGVEGGEVSFTKSVMSEAQETSEARRSSTKLGYGNSK